MYRKAGIGWAMFSDVGAPAAVWKLGRFEEVGIRLKEEEAIIATLSS